MDSDPSRNRLEELGIDPDDAEEVLSLLVEKKAPAEQGVPSLVDELRAKLSLESDPTKRAILAAKVISLSLEDGY